MPGYPLRGKHKIVFLFFSERCFALPTNRYIIGSGIQGTFQYNLLFILTDNGRRVLIIRSPVASIITMATCRIRETEIDAGMRFRSNGGSHHIGFRMTGGLYLKRFAINLKLLLMTPSQRFSFCFISVTCATARGSRPNSKPTIPRCRRWGLTRNQLAASFCRPSSLNCTE